VTARATDRAGRSDESIGAVAIGGLKGDALCNALMKAETKAKRRATLAIVGLSFLDESEVETVQGARRVDLELPDPGPNLPRMAALRAEMDAAEAAGSIDEWTDDLMAQRDREAAITAQPADQPPPTAPGDDVDQLTGEALADACDRLRRRLSAANLPYPPIPNPRTVRSLREWWHTSAAILSARGR
jgi:hypothetical protein